MFACNSQRRTIVNQGAALIEILFALTLGLFMLSIFLEAYNINQSSLRLQNVIYQMEDRAASVVTILTTEIKRAGSVGCPHLSAALPIRFYSGFSITPQNKLVGSNTELMVRYARLRATIIKAMQTNLELYTTNNTHFSPGNVLIVSDCVSAEIAKVNQVFQEQDLQRIVLTRALNKTYKPYTEIGRFQMNRYFIKRTSRKNTDGSSIYALFVMDAEQHQTELVDGVTKLRLRYSIKQRGNLLEVQAQQIVDWSKVLGLAIDFEISVPPLTKTWHLYVALEK